MYHKIPKISPGAYFSEALFEGVIFGGAYFRNFTVFNQTEQKMARLLNNSYKENFPLNITRKKVVYLSCIHYLIISFFYLLLKLSCLFELDISGALVIRV